MFRKVEDYLVIFRMIYDGLGKYKKTWELLGYFREG
jgi:hypothetical protein